MAIAIASEAAQAAPRILIDDDEIIILELREADAQVVTLVREAADPEAAIHQCLAVGARALRSAQISVDASVVEKEFGHLRTALDTRVSAAVDQFDELTARLLDDDDGELRQTLNAHKAELEKLLGELFDPDSKRSALAKFEQIFGQIAGDQLRILRTAVDPDDERSPLGRLRTELVRAVSDQGKNVTAAVTDLAERVASKQATADMLELTAIKGRTFEELVFELSTAFVSLFGDLVDPVGDRVGIAGARTGDIVVTLNPEDTGGIHGAYVIEAKDRKLGLKAALDELDKAIVNRGAAAGLMVFAQQAKAPVATPFRYFDNKAIVVVDKDGDDHQALRLALMWARWIVQRRSDVRAGELDFQQATALIDDGMRALTRLRPIKTALSTAGREIGKAEGQVLELAREMEETLSDLSGLLRAG